MKKPIKKRKVVKKPKEDNKTDVVYVRYLLEDMEAVIAIIPENEKMAITDSEQDALLIAVKKVHTRVKTISKLFKQKYTLARFDKVEGISNAIVKKGKENPRFKYSFLRKEYIDVKSEIGKSIGQI